MAEWTPQERCVCIHGHFHQPPRDNPWLEVVEQQDSAHPYHDWNEHIAAECYGPNAASRALSADGRIIDIVNNYSRISFDFGASLLTWLAQAQPETYAAILEADRMSREFYDGHGSAIAQPYAHTVLPLASSADKRTQIIWGKRDFELRFGRPPEGMWLPEGAVDLEALVLLAELGLRFTILAPHQAARVRRIGEQQWHDLDELKLDTRQPYRCVLPGGREIALFFYDGPSSHEAARGELLRDGEVLAQRLVSAFGVEPAAQLVNIATDGEAYGHHHPQGEMTLTSALHRIETDGLARITVYGQYLAQAPPTHEVEIYEPSASRCRHGMACWQGECECLSGRHTAWHQRWRAPLRAAFDWLREQLLAVWEELAPALLGDPRTARDAYIEVIFNRAEDNVRCYLEQWQAAPIARAEQVRALQLLEMERHAMLMYASCGWSAEEISGIETVQLMQHASRALQLALEAGGPDLEPAFIERLREAPSNLAEHGDGALIYDKFVRPARVELQRVAAHFAIASLFREFASEVQLHAYRISTGYAERLQAGKVRLALGRIRVCSTLVWETRELSFAVLHLGDQNLNGAIREYVDVRSFNRMLAEIKQPFERGDVPETIRRLDQHFGTSSYSLWHLFRDQQREIMHIISQDVEERIEAFYQQVYREHYHLLQAMQRVGILLPPIFRATVEFVVNTDLRRCLEQDPLDQDEFERLLGEISKWGIAIDQELLGWLGTQQIDHLVGRLAATPLEDELLDEIAQLFAIYSRLKAPLNLWRSQNLLYRIGQQQFFLRTKMAERGEENAVRWVKHFRRLSTQLGVRFE